MAGRRWVLAVDFGTTNTVAVVAAEGEPPRLLQVDGAPMMPSAVYLDEAPGQEPTWLVGPDADNTARVDPSRYEPSPKRAMAGGHVFLGGSRIEVTVAVSQVLRQVFTEAVRQHGGAAPAVLVLTHPVLWHGARLTRLAEAARLAAEPGSGLPDFPEPVLLAEPVAAAWHVSRAAHLPENARIAVVDLGGGTCDVAVVDRAGGEFTVAGPPLGADPLGGDDFDVRLMADVLAELDDPQLTERLTAPATSADQVAALDLRRAARDAKETLSRAPRAHVRVPAVPGVLPEGASVQVAQYRLEQLVTGDRTTPGLRTAGELAGQALAEAPPGPPVAGVFLVGGSSRIPLLGRIITEETGHPPSEHGDPATAVAEGAAMHGMTLLAAETRARPEPGPGPRPHPEPEPDPPGPRHWWQRHPAAAAASAAVLLLATVIGLIALISGPLSGESTATSSSTPPPSYTCADGTVVESSSECRTPPPETKECWDGSSVPETDPCPAVEGEEALRWVFSPDPAFSNCTRYTGELNDGELEAYECQWSDHPDMYVYLSRYSSTTAQDDTLILGDEDCLDDYRDWVLHYSDGSTDDIGDVCDDSSATDNLSYRYLVYDDVPYSIQASATTGSGDMGVFDAWFIGRSPESVQQAIDDAG